MNTKSTFTMLVIALVLIIGAFFYHRRQNAVIAEAAIPQRTLHTALTSSTVERIEINSPGEPMVTLTRTGDMWYTDAKLKHEADPSAVNGIFNAMKNDLEGEVVSENPDSYSDYEVTDTSGTRVKIFEKGKPEPAIDLVVGKDGPTAMSTFIREAAGKEVLDANASLGMIFKKPDGWRDKRIFDFSGSQARSLEEKGTSSTFEIAKEKDIWKFKSPNYGAAKDTAISGITNSLGSLRTNKFPELSTTRSLTDFGLEPPFQTIRFTYEDSASSPSKTISHELKIGREKNGEYYAMRGDKSDIYTINDYIVRNLLTDPKTLAANPPEETTATEHAKSAVKETTATKSVAPSAGTSDAAKVEKIEHAPPAPTNFKAAAPLASELKAQSEKVSSSTAQAAKQATLNAMEKAKATPVATAAPVPPAPPVQTPAPTVMPEPASQSTTMFNKETSISTTLSVKPHDSSAPPQSITPPPPATENMATSATQ